ncbi:MAG: thio(seleno)oxazole modification radical SAM maturase SbtM [Pelovirga sp.]
MVEVKYLCPRTWSLLSPPVQAQLQQGYAPGADVRETLRHLSPEPAWLPDLAAVELANGRLRSQPPVPLSPSSEQRELNPSLEVVAVAWRGLLPVLDGSLLEPEQGEEFLLFWRHPRSGRFRCDVAAAADLLALKIIVEGHDPRAIAAATAQPVAVVDRAVEKAVERGLLLSPPSRLVRSPATFPAPAGTAERYLSSPAFTLQWHITQSCDLHCRHCYDRSEQADIALDKGMQLLDQMRDFCLQRHVYGQISFSGGNPFLHPDFFPLYRAAVERNLIVAVLGNPVSEEMLRQLLTIAPPAFYQVSLEGLMAHNDEIRGPGNFAAVVNFLDLLRRHQVPSRVMLTLTEKNMEEVLPLAEFLRDKADLFTYNRLAMVGEGAALQSALGGGYQAFIRDYIEAKQHNPIIAQKDNLINIERDNQGLELFGGCTGYGCGAAFNFFAIVPNGDVHACRKYPSPIGNIHRSSLADIYDSERARAYREGPSECAGCHLRPVCGGCPAVTYGCGLAPLTRRDPACFVERK